MKATRALGVALLIGLVPGALAYKEVAPPPNIVLPRSRPPAESLAAIKVADGLEVELVAAEPLVMDPVDMAFGADGKLWVVEMADYPNGVGDPPRPGGRVRFLESTRGDGRYDKSTLFAEGLAYPTSVLPWRSGVIVTSIPDILLLEDTDGDGKADRRTRLFSGLGEGNPQHLVNGLQWSLDGWLHLANGDSGGKVRSEKTGRIIELGRRDFQIHPDSGGLEFLTGQTQVGRARDDWGNWFGCNNSNPFWHYALEERYLRRNPHFVPPSASVSISTIPGAAPVFPRSETLARFNDPHGHNHFTSACNVVIYRDDFLGREFAGGIFVSEPVHNLVSRQVLRPAGASFKSERAASERTGEFLASADNWSRFAGLRPGPDGALYIADMYRLVIEHPKWIPEAWQKQLGDLRAGSDQGRIYRVKPKGKPLRAVPRLDRAATAELVAAIDHPSGVVRDLAQQQLQWRADRGAAGALERLARTTTRPEARVQALWTLAGLQALEAPLVREALRDPHPGVRRHAVRLAEAWVNSAPDLLEAIVALAGDADPAVRQQVAYTLGEWPGAVAGAALARLLEPEQDTFVRAAAMSSALPHATTLLAELRKGGSATESVMMELAAATDNARALADILQAIARRSGEAETAAQFGALAQLLDWLQRNNRTLAQLQAGGDAATAAALQEAEGVFERARRVAIATGAPLSQRLAAVAVVGRGRTRQNEDIELLAGLLGPQSPVELQLAAARALGRINRNTVPERLLAGWAGYGPRVRAAVLQLLISRPAWAQVLLDKAENDRALAAQIDAGSRLALTEHSNSRLAQRAAGILLKGTDETRTKVVERYQTALAQRPGDLARGAGVFAQVCSACHAFGTVAAGRAIGPDIAAVKDRSPGYLLTHILDPNRAVEDRYVLYSAALQDGRGLAGMLASEASHSLTLIGLDGVEQTVLRSEVRTLVSTGRSLMPEGLEGAIDEQAMADLIAFLAGKSGGAK